MSLSKSRHTPVHMALGSVVDTQAVFDARAVVASAHASPLLPPLQRVLILELYVAATYIHT